jgi:hypothetical protein
MIFINPKTNFGFKKIFGSPQGHVKVAWSQPFRLKTQGSLNRLIASQRPSRCFGSQPDIEVRAA